MSRISVISFAVLSVLVLTLSPILANAQTVTTLLRSGPSGVKKDLVVVGDGFTADQQGNYNTFVNNFVMNGVFANGLYREDMNAFNIYRINANSQDSGVTQVDANGNVTTARNTVLDYRFSGVWDRCWMEQGPNTNANLNALLSSLVPQYDFVFIVLNESGFGGCAGGGKLAITTAVNWNVGSHEMGHMVGGLADEYTRPGNYAGGEPGSPNATINLNRNTIKWKDFINPSTPLPTAQADVTDLNQDAGAVEGAIYKTTGVYRPAFRCRMNQNWPPLCPVCYNHTKEALDPIHDYTYDNSYVGDFNGDGRDDVLIHNANSIAIYQSTGSELELMWVATGEIPLWDDIKAGDKFFVADFDGNGSDDVYVFNITDWAIPYFAMLRSDGTGLNCIRRYDLELPGWDDMRDHDEFFVADFNGDGKEDIYVFNGQDWSVAYLEMLRSTGDSLVYTRRFDDVLPGWDSMKRHDEFFVGDFNNDNNDDIYVFNGQDWSMAYLEMLRSTGNNLVYVRRYDDKLPGWDSMKRHDEFYVGDFNADNRDDIYVFNGRDWSMEYLEMLRSDGAQLIAVRRFDGSIPGWDGMATHDKFYVADINGDNRDDLYVYNSADWVTEYLGILHSKGGNTLDGWWQSGWVNNWNLGGNDKFLVGNFNGGSGWDDLFVRNRDWFGMLRSSSSSTSLNSIYPKWIHNHRYHRLGWW